MNGEDIVIAIIVVALGFALFKRITETYEPPTSVPTVTAAELGKVFDEQNLAQLPEKELERRKFIRSLRK